MYNVGESTLNPPMPPGPGARAHAPQPSLRPASDSFLDQILGRLDPAMVDALPNLPRATLKATDPLGVCLQELRDQYLGTQKLPGTLHVEHRLPGLDLPEAPMSSVLEHLVEGALRDNPSPHPYCHVGVAGEDATHVTLYVRDNGRELPECGIDELRRFVRDSKDLRVPDRVYRLFLADNLVQWLGGTIWIGPAPNAQGACVFLKLPRRRPTPSA